MESEDHEVVEVLISAIEHYSYCPRQCALIHVEQSYDENLYTVRGTLAHQRVHSGQSGAEGDVLIRRDIPLWSERLHLRGKADLVEFRPDGPYPVEYKVGKRRGLHADLQLCAQALCLEEMLDVAVLQGAVFYTKARRRREVLFDKALRTQTTAVIEAIRADLQSQTLPSAPNDSRCHHCSLINICLPMVVGTPARLRGLQGALFHPWGEEGL